MPLTIPVFFFQLKLKSFIDRLFLFVFKFIIRYLINCILIGIVFILQYLEVGVLGPNGPNVTLNVGVASKNGLEPVTTPLQSITVQAVKVHPLKRSPVLSFARLLMGPGVRGPLGLPAVPIACNLGVGTVIILSRPMAGDTARAMIWLAETVPVACVNVSYMLNKIYICFYSLGI